MIYGLILRLRNRRFGRKAEKLVSRAEVPTVCIGNVAVGGTGKTPHTEMVLRMLLESDRWGNGNIAVLSRGYKRSSRGFQQVMMDGSASLCGDEPLQVKKKFPCVTVAVDKDRVEGCSFLVHPELLQTSKKAKRCEHKEMPASGIIILDDAYQYRRLAADLNIVLADWNRPVTEDRLLPYGRLRDLPSRLFDADIVIITKCPDDLTGQERESAAIAMGFTSYDRGSCTATAPDGRIVTVLFTTVRYGQSVPVYGNSNPRYVYSKKLVLFTGIADDTALRNYLSDTYRIISRFRFPDHHRFRSSDFARISAAVRRDPTAAVATTEKDAQRILDYSGMPEILRERLFMVPIEAAFLSEDERGIFLDRLLAL